MNVTAGSATKRREVRLGSTVAIVVGLLVTGVLLPSDSSVAIFSFAAYGVGLALAIAVLIEARCGIRALIRVDLLMFAGLYSLTLLEFLFRQPEVAGVVGPASAANGTYAVLLAFAAMAIGRHCVPIKATPASAAANLRPSSVFFVFIVVTFLGYLNILLAVHFNIYQAMQEMLLPRFSQSWARGQFGNASALLYEVGALVNLIPPMTGLIFARAREYSMIQKIVVAAVFAFTMFYGFSSGTRNVYVSYILTFAGIYLITKPRLGTRHAVIFGTIMIGFILVGMTLMLQFRTVGLGELSRTQASDTLYIDLDIVNIARLTDKFPDVYDYLGLEIPFNAVIRPIPRVLWPGKPIGLSVPIETALDAGPGLTVSCTYIGEAYMTGGFLGVLIISLMFGAAAEMWNRVGLSSNDQFKQILYVSGFLCAAIGMRSMLSMFPLMLPTLGMWVFGKLWLARAAARAARSAAGRRIR